MNRLTLTLGLALGFGTVVGSVPTAPYAEAKSDPYTLADWDKAFEGKLEDAAGYYVKLAKWCDSNGLQWTATRMRRYTFMYQPEDADLRKYFGYEKQDGRWIQNDLKRDEFRTQFIDDEDPNGAKFRKSLSVVVNKISKDFAAMGKKADKAADDPEQAANVDEWKARAKQAWFVVLDLRPDEGEEKKLYKQALKDQESAHQALGHPKFEGQYVTPFQLKHVEIRSERVRKGKEIAATDPEAQEIPLEPPIASAGLAGGAAAKSKYMACHTTHGKEVAVRTVKAAEKAIADAVETYGFPPETPDRGWLKALHIVKPGDNDQFAEWKRCLEVEGWSAAKIEKYREAGLTGVGVAQNGRIQISSGGKDVEDHAINATNQSLANAAGRIAAQTVGARIPSPEDWLWQSMGYDATMRLNDTTITQWGAFGKYGQQARARPGQNIWITLARQQVELDDDVTMTQLYEKEIDRQEFRGPEMVKGYAYLQFLFESDPAKAKEFVWNALTLGTPAALMNVYGAGILGEDNVPEMPDKLPTSTERGRLPEPFQKVMDAMEDRYRTWILKAN